MNYNYQLSEVQAQYLAKLEKRQIRAVGSLLGAAIICYILVSTIFSNVLVFSGKFEIYKNDSTLQLSLDIIVTLLAMLVPFLLMGKVIERKTNLPASAPLDKPGGGLAFNACAVVFGLGLCMAGNIVTGFIVSLSKLIGHEFTAPELNYPDGVPGFILSAVRVALLAALCEELSFRGVALQPLRRHGEWFAVICSSCVFAIMHGNLVQAPFALIAGIGLGWICIKTGSVWPSMIVHFLNNLFSVSISYLHRSPSLQGESALKIESLILYSLMGLGALCGSLFITKAKTMRTDNSVGSLLSFGQKAFAFFINVPMLVAVAYMFFVTTFFIK